MVDTLVIGAGTAGCVVAARSSEDSRRTVHLVEAGTMWWSQERIPLPLRDATWLPIDDQVPWLWRYPVALTTQRQGTIVRGRGAGGSSAVNGCYFIRATAEDFAAWSSEADAPEWAFDQVLPFFRAMEHDLDYGSRPGHGSNGPVPVRRTSRPAELTERFIAACAARGVEKTDDLNALPGRQPASRVAGAAPVVTDGVGLVPCNVGPEGEDGFRARISTADSYLLPASARPNLTVTDDTTVTRLRFSGRRVVGADCVRNGIAETVWADRVVLCAGAVESAALLLRSGIGPPAALRDLGIPVVHGAPVGQWCTDHPEIGIEYHHRSALERTVALESVLESGDIELRPYTVAFAPEVRHLGIALMRPQGASMLRIRSADPSIPPAIDYNYSSEFADRSRLHEGAELAADLLEHMGAEPVNAARPPAALDHVHNWLVQLLGTSQHLSGTCRMGGVDDPRAVVDAKCRVHGVSGLSVVDLSIVPVPLGRGPQATTVMLAERANALMVAE